MSLNGSSPHLAEKAFRRLRQILGRPSAESELWQALTIEQRGCLLVAARLSIARAGDHWSAFSNRERAQLESAILTFGRVAEQLQSLRQGGAV